MHKLSLGHVMLLVRDESILVQHNSTFFSTIPCFCRRFHTFVGVYAVPTLLAPFINQKPMAAPIIASYSALLSVINQVLRQYFHQNARDTAKLMLMQKLSFLLPARAGVRAGPSCTLRGHSRCRRRTATVAGRPTGGPEWRDAVAFDSLGSCDGMSGGSAAAVEWRDGLTVNTSECFVLVDLASWTLTGSLDGSQRAVDGCEWNSGGKEWRSAAPRCSAD